MAMGVDLTLLPIRWRDGDRSILAHTMLDLERSSELWPEIEEIGERPLKRAIWCYYARREDGECEYGEVDETDYGMPLTYLLPSQLLTLKDHPEVVMHDENKAAWAYLSALTDDWKIVLFWH